MTTGPATEAMLAAARDPATWLGLSWTREALVLRFLAAAAWMLGALCAAGLAPRAVARAAEALRSPRPAHAGAGLLFHGSAALAIALAAAMASMPAGLGVLVIVALAVATVRAAGLAAAFMAMGSRFARGGAASAYAQLLAGTLAAGIASFVPVAGPLAWLLLACAGTGALLATWRSA